MTNVVSRFRVSKDDPNKADPASEEELLRIRAAVLEPRRRHDLSSARTATSTSRSATAARPTTRYDNGQNLKTLLGKVLRIDVDRKDDGKNYAIPKDNPFVGNEGRAAGDLGLRPAQRLADGVRPQDGRALGRRRRPEPLRGDQHHREGRQLRLEPPRGAAPVRRRRASGRSKDLIEPIWEYHHDVGKSITGGRVYRGKRLPELDGHYLYADYVTGQDLGPEVRRGNEARRRQPADPGPEQADPVVRRGRAGRSLLPRRRPQRPRDLSVREVSFGPGVSKDAKNANF